MDLPVALTAAAAFGGQKGVFAMRFLYEPFILRRVAEGRILFVSPRMPFEFFVHCFQAEQPFFLISQLEDGRLAITPNTMFIPWNLEQGAFNDLLPTDIEYVTMRNATYPVLLTAHPIVNLEEWFRKFERLVAPFARQTLSEFVASAHEFMPIEVEPKNKVKVRQPLAEPALR
jgi:hypothetical protein